MHDSYIHDRLCNGAVRYDIQDCCVRPRRDGYGIRVRGGSERIFIHGGVGLFGYAGKYHGAGMRQIFFRMGAFIVCRFARMPYDKKNCRASEDIPKFLNFLAGRCIIYAERFLRISLFLRSALIALKISLRRFSFSCTGNLQNP